MKTLFTLGACALLATTLFSCTADEFETADSKTEIKKDITKTQAGDGPEDDPIVVPPPPIKKP